MSIYRFGALTLLGDRKTMRPVKNLVPAICKGSSVEYLWGLGSEKKLQVKQRSFYSIPATASFKNL